MYFRSLLAEYKKSKRTLYFWFTIVSSLLIPLIMFLIYVFKTKHFIPPEGENPWESHILHSYTSISSMLFPFFVIVLISLITQTEHSNNAWKKIFVLPLRKGTFYFSKLTFILIIVYVSLILFNLGILASGYLSALIKSELNYLVFSPDFLILFKYSLTLFVNVLGIIAIQYLISLLFKNFIIPVSLGLFLTITALILANTWKNAKYFPYAFPELYLSDIRGVKELEHVGIFTITEFVSIATFILFALIALVIFVKRKVK